MVRIADDRPVAHRVDPREVEAVEVMGPLVEFLTSPAADDCTPCTMRGTIPPGMVVPLHRHGDPETYLIVSGEADGLAETSRGLDWLPLRPGDLFHVPGDAKHAFRNHTDAAAVMLIVSTSKIGRFFREIGTPAVKGRGPRRRHPRRPRTSWPRLRAMATGMRRRKRMRRSGSRCPNASPGGHRTPSPRECGGRGRRRRRPAAAGGRRL
jgi:quercetin dioxygenase-like cupin family protein